MEWVTPEFTDHHKSRDWYAVVVIIAIGLILGEILLGEVLIIVLTILATVTFLLVSLRKPNDLHVAIEPGGVRVQGEYHPFASLHSFAVVESVGGHKLILESTKRMTPYMIVPLGEDVDPNDVRELLSRSIIEEDLHEPLSHIIFERLGF